MRMKITVKTDNRNINLRVCASIGLLQLRRETVVKLSGTVERINIPVRNTDKRYVEAKDITPLGREVLKQVLKVV